MFQMVIRTANSKGKYTKAGILVFGEISDNLNYIQKKADDWNNLRQEKNTLNYDNGLYYDPYLKADVYLLKRILT
jgi:hypothetical protein